MAKENQKTAVFRFRLTQQELSRIEWAAMDVEKTTSRWAREILLQAAAEPAKPPEPAKPAQSPLSRQARAARRE